MKFVSTGFRTFWQTYTRSLQQRVQSCLARVVRQQRKSCRVHTLLRSLHWLPTSQRIDFKLTTLAFKIQSTYQHEYLRQLISNQLSGSSVSLRSCAHPLLQAPRTRTLSGSLASLPNKYHHHRTAYGSRAFRSFGCTSYLE